MLELADDLARLVRQLYPDAAMRSLCAKKPDHKLRNPIVFSEVEKIYLLHSVAGKQGIAMTRPKKQAP